MARYLDCHLHLQDERLSGRVDDVLKRAKGVGVCGFVCNGASESDWEEVLRLANEHEDIFPCFGLHPWYVKDRSADWLDKLEQYLLKVPSGVGEIGLDRLLDDRDEALQEEVFLQQLALSRWLGRPVSIHSARASGWLLEVLKREHQLPDKLHLHAFGGSAELVREFVRLGAYFSFAGNAFQSGRRKLHDAIRAVPVERLLSETDCPDIPPPVQLRASELLDESGKPLSEPGNLPGMVKQTAQLRGEDGEALAARLVENGEFFFNLQSYRQA